MRRAFRTSIEISNGESTEDVTVEYELRDCPRENGRLKPFILSIETADYRQLVNDVSEETFDDLMERAAGAHADWLDRSEYEKLEEARDADTLSQ